jgi:hypothetical protein
MRSDLAEVLKYFYCGFLIWFVFFLPACQISSYGSSPADAPDELLVVMKNKSPDFQSWLKQENLKSSLLQTIVLHRGTTREKHVFRIQPDRKVDLSTKARRLKSLPGVVHVQPNYRYHLLENLPDDPSFSQQWGLKNTGQFNGTPGADIHAPAAWEITTGTHAVVVAVIDTGVDYTHPDLQANLWTNPGEINPSDGIDDDDNGYVDDWRGWDFHDNDNDPWDDHSHGTHVSGIIGAAGNNGVGVSGVCWQVTLMPLDTFDSSGESLTSSLVEAIAYAEMMGAKLINASWGDPDEDPLLEETIRSFTAAGGLFIAAAGNENGKDNDVFTSFPANYSIDGLLSVGASNVLDQAASFSSIGNNRVHLFAPGSGIYSTYPTTSLTYGMKSGTSMAAPMVTGAAALLCGWNPALDNLSIKYRLMGTVDRLDALEDLCKSGGRLNAAALFGPDIQSPSAVVDLTAVDRDYDRLTVEYSVTGDDGMMGAARFVDLRYSHNPITPANWDTAFRVDNEPAPALPGSVQSVEVTGLDEDTDYYFRMRVIDKNGNLSPLSNEASGRTRQVRVLFADDVESGTEGWSVAGDAPHWATTSLRSRSGNFCWTDSPDSLYTDGQRSLVSPVVDLSHAIQPVLRFWHRFDTEPVFDVDFIEVQSSTDGLSWNTLARWKDTADWWRPVTIDLDAFRGQPRWSFRFLLSVASVERYDGWYVDDIRVLDVERETGFRGWEFY